MNASIRRRPYLIVPILLCATLVACTGAGGPRATPSSSAAAAPSASAVPPAASASRDPSAAPSTAPPPASAGPVPAKLLARVLTLAAKETGVDRTAIVVVSAEPVTWKDASFDCPRMGVMYMHGAEAGYKIVVTAGHRTLDYRSGRSGDARLCLPPGA